MKLVLIAIFTINFCLLPFIGSAQKKYTLEFEAAPIVSNRVFIESSSSSNSYVSQYRAQSKIFPGFYLQFGANFRVNKPTRFFVGARALNQQVMVSHLDIYNIYVDPGGNLVVDGFARSVKTDMIYLLFPLSVKQNLISKPDFRLVGEIGISPGFLIGSFSDYIQQGERPALSSELALSFEKKLKNGNLFGVKFPALSYSLLPNSSVSKGANQHNYSLGFGIKFGFGNFIPITEAQEKPKNFSFEGEIATVFSDSRILFDEKLFQNYNPNSSDYLDAKSEFEDYTNAERKPLLGGYLQFGINFRENKRTRFFTGLRIFEQRVMATATHVVDITTDTSGMIFTTTEYGFEPIHMMYLSTSLSVKQTIVSKPTFRFVTELGIVPGILIYDSTKPQYSKGEFTAMPAEISLSFEKKLKSGNWIGIKIPSFNYSLFSNTNRNVVRQFNYSIGVGVKLTLPQ